MGFREQVWSERFRPDNLDSVIGNERQVNRMKDWIDDDSVPHLLLHGPAGTGKSSSVIAFAKSRYGDEWSQNLIEYNASSDRGIDIVRNDIKQQAASSASSNYQRKIIMLDEVDSMTSDAQAALRRVMEKYTDQTIFALVCNRINKLIDPIQSRCAPLAFQRLDDSEIETLVKQILDQEDIEYQQSTVDVVVSHVGGDARRATHTLQTSVENGKLVEENVEIVGGQVDDSVVEEMIFKCFNGQMDEAHEMVVTDVLPNVTDYSQFTGTLMKEIQQSDELPRDVKFSALAKIGDLERNILEGANPHVQIVAWLSKLPVLRYSSIPSYEENE